MKTISLGLEESLFKGVTRRAKELGMTRTELIRNAIMELLLGYSDISDIELIREAQAEDDGTRYTLEEVRERLKKNTD